MRFILLAALAFAGVLAKECTTPGYYGDDCNSICGMCKDDAVCDKDGKCPDGKCADGWSGDVCKTAECFGNAGCSEGGKCVAPDYCVCGELGAQIVGKQVNKNGVEGTDCVSLRKDGIKGAGIAMVVMFLSIGFCGTVERMRNKSK